MATMLIDGTKEVSCRTAEANAIRAKTGGTATISYDFDNGKGFADAIAGISGAKPEQSKTLTLGAAAPSTVTPDSGKVLSSVPVMLDASVIKAENIKKDVTMLGVTGTYAPTLQSKTATANGTVTPSSGYYGLSSVTVAIPIYEGTVI